MLALRVKPQQRNHSFKDRWKGKTFVSELLNLSHPLKMESSLFKEAAHSRTVFYDPRKSSFRGSRQLQCISLFCLLVAHIQENLQVVQFTQLWQTEVFFYISLTPCRSSITGKTHTSPSPCLLFLLRSERQNVTNGDLRPMVFFFLISWSMIALSSFWDSHLILKNPNQVSFTWDTVVRFCCSYRIIVSMQ